MRKYFIIVFLLIFTYRIIAQIHVGPGQKYPTIYAVSYAKLAHPGDTIFMHAGIYTDHGQVFDSLIGTPSKWIYIRPWHNDSVSIHVTYTFMHSQYLNVSGLNFYGNDAAQSAYVYHLLFFDYNYDCFTGNHHIVVDHCNFTNLNNTGKTNTGAMLKIDGTDNFQVTNCLFKDGINITDGISLNANRNGLISRNRFENMPGDGSHCKGGSKRITYEKNLFINCDAGGLDVGGDTDPAFFCPLGAGWEADSINVFSNIFIGGKTGIRLSSCHNSRIFNNTCFKTTSFAFRSLNASSNPIYLLNNYVFNNIFTTNSVNHIYLNASSAFNYNTEYFYNNLFHDYKFADPASLNWTEMPGVNLSGNIIGDPKFVDTLNGNFALQKTSIAKGAGFSVTEPATDYNGFAFQTTRSIGAIEYAGNTGIEKPFDANALAIFPNPSDGVFTIQCNVDYDKQLEVYNLLGQHIVSQSLNENSRQLDLSSYPKGIYKVVIHSDEGQNISKTIILK